MESQPNVLLIDPKYLTRNGPPRDPSSADEVRSLLERQPQCATVEEAKEGNERIVQIRLSNFLCSEHSPDASQEHAECMMDVLQGQFDTVVQGTVGKIRIDMAGFDFLPERMMGMLFAFGKKLKEQGRPLTIVNASPRTMMMAQTMNFYKLATTTGRTPKQQPDTVVLDRPA